VLMERLNRFLFESTQAHKYATLFYAELDPKARRLVYVNGGHVPPYWLRGQDTAQRLGEGGPALGLLEEARYEEGEVSLRPGDVVAMVTDGVTEATSPADEEFGESALGQALRRLSDGSADAILAGLVDSVRAWVGPAGCADDLTALVLKAQPDP